MDKQLLLDMHRRHVEQSKGMDIREYAAHMLRLHELKEAAKSRSNSPPNKSTVPGVIRNDEAAQHPSSCSGPSAKACPPEHIAGHRKSLWPQASPTGVSHEVYHKIQQTVRQSGGNHFGSEEHVSQQKPKQFALQIPATERMNNVNHSGATPDCQEDYDEDCIQRLMSKPNSNMHFSSIATTSLQGPVVQASRAPSYGAGSDPSGLTSEQVSYDGSGSRGKQKVQARRQDGMTCLESCIEALYCVDASPRSREVAKMRVSDAEGNQNSKQKKSARSPKISQKKSKAASAKPKTGISKRGKPDRNPGVLKRKDFICPHDGCGKGFERRYNLKVHARKHNGQMPYICPKAEEGCFLSFKWRSSLRHHLKAVHNDVVPIAQSSARGTVVTTPVVQTSFPLPQNTHAVSSSATTRGRIDMAAGSSKLRVSETSGIKKTARKRKGKVRKNFPAVAVRQPTAEELERARRFAEQKAKAEQAVRAEEVPETAVAMTGHSNSVRSSMVVDPEPNLASKLIAPDGTLDTMAFLDADESELPPLTGSLGALEAENGDGDIDDIFGGIDTDVPPDFVLPMLDQSNP